MEMVRSMMNHGKLPLFLWGHALETALHTLNRVPTKLMDRTQYEAWNGRKPNLSYIRVWGCDAYVKSNFTDKLTPKSIKCKFVGYPKETKGYYFYVPDEHKIIVARYATFLESEFITNEVSGSNEFLEVISGTTNELDTEQPPSQEIVQDTQDLRRSGRSRQEPENTMDSL